MSPDEYPKFNVLKVDENKLQIYWKILENDTLEMALIAETTGWVAIGDYVLIHFDF